MDERDILNLYRMRDERAITETQAAYGKLLYRTALSVTSNASDAEECVSDTLRAVWEATETVLPDCLKAYLLRTVRRKALDVVRRESRRKRKNDGGTVVFDELCDCLPAYETPETAAENARLAETLNAWLRALDAPKRRAFVLRYYYEMPLYEVARRLGFTRTKTANLLARLRADLKADLIKEDLYE